MSGKTEEKVLFDRSTWWKRFVLSTIGAMPLSGPGRLKKPTEPTIIPDATFFLPGGSAAVLAVHGLTGTPTEMRFVSRGLANAGFTVYSVQLAGHCGSEEDLLHTNWHDWYASVEAAIARIAEKHDSIFMIGLSVGALLSLHYSAQNPGKIKGLGLMSMTLRYDGWSTPKLRWLLPLFLYTPMGGHYRFVENYPYGIKDERLRQRVVANMLSGNSAESGNLGMTGYSLRQLFSLVRTIKKELPKITTPSIVLHASNDDVASRWNADYVAGHLGGPCRKVLLDDCYHMITVDKQRDVVIKEMADYFRALVRPEELTVVTPDFLKPAQSKAAG